MWPPPPISTPNSTTHSTPKHAGNNDLPSNGYSRLKVMFLHSTQVFWWFSNFDQKMWKSTNYLIPDDLGVEFFVSDTIFNAEFNKKLI